MKYKNRKEEAMARFAAKEAEKANEAAWKNQIAMMKEMKTLAEELHVMILT